MRRIAKHRPAIYTLVAVSSDAVKVARIIAWDPDDAAAIALDWIEANAPGTGDSWHVVKGALGIVVQGPAIHGPAMPGEEDRP